MNIIAKEPLGGRQKYTKYNKINNNLEKFRGGFASTSSRFLS